MYHTGKLYMRIYCFPPRAISFPRAFSLLQDFFLSQKKKDLQYQRTVLNEIRKMRRNYNPHTSGISPSPSSAITWPIMSNNE